MPGQRVRYLVSRGCLPLRADKKNTSIHIIQVAAYLLFRGQNIITLGDYNFPVPFLLLFISPTLKPQFSNMSDPHMRDEEMNTKG